jgi:hypothetical protein
LLLNVGDYTRNDVVVLILGIENLNEVGHDLLGGASSDFGALHDLDLYAENALAEFDVTDGNIDEILLGLTSGDLVTSVVLLGLCALASDFTRYDNFATGGATSSHDRAHDVVGSHTNGGAVKQLVLKGLDVCRGGQVLVVREGLY